MKTHGLICQSFNKIYSLIDRNTMRKKTNKKLNKSSHYIAASHRLKFGEKNALRPNV